MRARTYYLVVRSGATAEALAPSLARLVRGIDPELPLTDVRSMDARVADSLQPRRTPALAAGLFALAALLLAAVGLYGVMAYAVAARTSEFGIRMALGAVRADVLRLVLTQGARLVGGGLALGLVAALWTTTFMTPLLFGVSPTSPIALGGRRGRPHGRRNGRLPRARAARGAGDAARRASQVDPPRPCARFATPSASSPPRPASRRSPCSSSPSASAPSTAMFSTVYAVVLQAPGAARLGPSRGGLRDEPRAERAVLLGLGPELRRLQGPRDELPARWLRCRGGR